jgi:hypothetical protein
MFLSTLKMNGQEFGIAVDRLLESERKTKVMALQGGR